MPGLSRNDHLRWGETLGGHVFVWRSGVGIDARGNLVYAAGELDIVSLADVLRAAGAVRAMELDINSYWVSFDTFLPGAQPGPCRRNCCPNMRTQREPLPRTRAPDTSSPCSPADPDRLRFPTLRRVRTGFRRVVP